MLLSAGSWPRLLLTPLALVFALSPTSPADAGAAGTYRASAYSLRYPGGWKITHPSGLDAELVAPDGHALILAKTAAIPPFRYRPTSSGASHGPCSGWSVRIHPDVAAWSAMSRTWAALPSSAVAPP